MACGKQWFLFPATCCFLLLSLASGVAAGMHPPGVGMHKKPGVRPFVLRVDCGAATPRRDAAGQLWESDTYAIGYPKFAGRGPMTIPVALGQDFVYATETFGFDFTYIFPVPRPGYYLLSLRFAELVYHKSTRLFSVYVQDLVSNPTIEVYDPFTFGSGFGRPATEDIPVYTSRKIVAVRFKNIRGMAQVSGIVLRSSRRSLLIPPPPPNTEFSLTPMFRRREGPPLTKYDPVVPGPASTMDRSECVFDSRSGGLRLVLDGTRRCSDSSLYSPGFFVRGAMAVVMRLPAQDTRGIVASFSLLEPRSPRRLKRELRFDFYNGGDLTILEISNWIDGRKVKSNVSIDFRDGVTRWRKDAFYRHDLTLHANGRVEYGIKSLLIYNESTVLSPVIVKTVNFELRRQVSAGPVTWSLAPFEFSIKQVSVFQSARVRLPQILGPVPGPPVPGRPTKATAHAAAIEGNSTSGTGLLL